MKAYLNSVVGTCGLGVIYGFNTNSDVYMTDIETYNLSTKGTGFFVAGFVNTKRCKAMHTFLGKKYATVYQSPVRENNNSTRDFFFVIYDTRSPAAKEQK